MIVASNWGSYFMCPFSHLRCGILFRVSAYVRYCTFVISLLFLEISLLIKCGTLHTLRLGPLIHTTIVTVPVCVCVCTLLIYI
jgi:hypothetical protein